MTRQVGLTLSSSWWYKSLISASYCVFCSSDSGRGGGAKLSITTVVSLLLFLFLLLSCSSTGTESPRRLGVRQYPSNHSSTYKSKHTSHLQADEQGLKLHSDPSVIAVGPANLQVNHTSYSKVPLWPIKLIYLYYTHTQLTVVVDDTLILLFTFPPAFQLVLLLLYHDIEAPVLLLLFLVLLLPLLGSQLQVHRHCVLYGFSSKTQNQIAV